ESLDSVRFMLGEVEAGRNDGDGDYSAVTARLLELSQGESDGGEDAPVVHPHPVPAQAHPAADSSNEADPVSFEVPLSGVDSTAGVAATRPDAVAVESVRVDVHLLDNLVD